MKIIDSLFANTYAVTRLDLFIEGGVDVALPLNVFGDPPSATSCYWALNDDNWEDGDYYWTDECADSTDCAWEDTTDLWEANSDLWEEADCDTGTCFWEDTEALWEDDTDLWEAATCDTDCASLECFWDDQNCSWQTINVDWEDWPESCAASGTLDLFIQGSLVEPAVLPLYIGGRGTGTYGTLDLFLYNDTQTETLPLYIRGLGDADGHVPFSGQLDLYLCRWPSESLDLFIHGGPTEGTGSLDLYCQGHATATGWLPMYISGQGLGSGQLNLYVHGF